MKMPDVIVGVDCGTGGGIAYYKDNRHTAVKMPIEAKDMRDYFSHIKSISVRPLVFVEKQQQFHSDFATPGKPFRGRAQLDNYERIKTVLSILEIPYIEVAPITWQTKLRIHQKGEEYADRKRRYKEVANLQCQTVKANNNTADALLITQFARLILKYQPEWVETRLDKQTKKLF